MYVDIKDLVGEHVLDAVDFSNDQIEALTSEWDEHCQVMLFRLDGNVYAAHEDPDDGYRSCMRNEQFLVMDDNTAMKNVFDPVKVVGRQKVTADFSNEEDVFELIDVSVFELIDVSTGETVLEAGTDWSDEYYPCFVAAFHPEAMLINK